MPQHGPQRAIQPRETAASFARLCVEYWPVGRLKPYERNPRKNDKAVERHCQLGRAGIVLVRDGRLLRSHLRPLSLCARPRKTAIARAGDSWISTDGVPLGKDSARRRGGRETVGLGQQT